MQALCVKCWSKSFGRRVPLTWGEFPGDALCYRCLVANVLIQHHPSSLTWQSACNAPSATAVSSREIARRCMRAFGVTGRHRARSPRVSERDTRLHQNTPPSFFQRPLLKLHHCIDLTHTRQQARWTAHANPRPSRPRPRARSRQCTASKAA